MTTTSATRRRSALGVIASAGLLFAACGGDDGGDSATPDVVEGAAEPGGDDSSGGDDTNDATDEELALEFAGCMRDEGVDWPDPSTNADGSIDLLGGQGLEAIGDGTGRFDEATTVALETCGPIVEGASFLPGADELDEETQDLLLEFAQCLRDEGLDVADPDLSAVASGGPAALFGDGFDPTDPAAQDAIGVCQSLFAGGAGTAGS